MSLKFQKAERRAVRLKIAVDGPSGSGKTMGALALAHGITNGGRIALADSENGSASLYADRYNFDTVNVEEADPQALKQIIDLAVSEGYDALVIDSLSHVWQAVLNAKDKHERANPRSNSFANWGIFGPRWDDLIKHILHAPIHVIATMRSKQAYEQVENAGRKQIVKLGLQPQVRDGAEYEFSIVFSVNMAHHSEATKDRTSLFVGKTVDLCDADVHRVLVAWMNAGGPEPVKPRALPSDRVVRGKRLAEYSTDELKTQLAACRKDENREKYAELADDIGSVLSDRALGTDVDSKVERMKAAVDEENAKLPF